MPCLRETEPPKETKPTKPEGKAQLSTEYQVLSTEWEGMKVEDRSSRIKDSNMKEGI